MTKEQAFETWSGALSVPVQQNIRDGLEKGRSITREAFYAGWDARVTVEPIKESGEVVGDLGSIECPRCEMRFLPPIELVERARATVEPNSDVARYQWLKRESPHALLQIAYRCPSACKDEVALDVDAAVDAARAEKP